MHFDCRYPASDDEDEEDGNVSAMPSGPVDDSMTRDDAEAVKSAVLKMKNRLPPLLSCDSEAPDFKAMREDPERAPCVCLWKIVSALYMHGNPACAY